LRKLGICLMFLCFRVLPAGRLNFQNCEFISS
jgi:hypothetical protein